MKSSTSLLLLLLVAYQCNAFSLVQKVHGVTRNIGHVHNERRTNMPMSLSAVTNTDYTYQDEYNNGNRMKKYEGIQQSSNSTAGASIATKSKLVFPGSRALHPIKQAFALSHNEITISMVQLALLLTTFGLVRIPSVAEWSTKIFQCFPYQFMLDYEHLSAVDWTIHYSALAYNIGVMRGLWTKRNEDDGKVSMKRRSFAIGMSGLGQVLGISLMISHSLIGTGSPAQQAFHNFSAFLMKFTAMSIGGFMLLPPVGSMIFSSLVACAIMKGLVSFQNMFGILLSNFGLIAILTSSRKDFPVKFKIGYMVLTLFPVASIIIDSTIGGGTDLGHTLGVIWLSSSTIIQRMALI